MSFIHRLLGALLVVIVIASLSIPASAAGVDQAKLKNACSALEVYIYPSVYQSSTGYTEFLKALNQSKTVANADGSTDAQIENAYNELRSAFVQLMMNTYDFSGIEKIVSMESWIDSSLYSEESYTAFISEVTNCRTELTNPHLFALDDREPTEYKIYMQSKIKEIEQAATEKYNGLTLKVKPENMTLKSLQSLVNAMDDALSIFQSTELSEAYLESHKEAETVLRNDAAANEAIVACAEKLIPAYDELIRGKLDFSGVNKTLADALSAKASDYTDATYLPFTEAVARLSGTLSQPVLFHVPSYIEEAERKTYAQDVVNTLDDELEALNGSLISNNRIDDLKALCEKYQGISANATLSSFHAALNAAVNDGWVLLAKSDYTSEELEEAIQSIEGAAENLQKTVEEFTKTQTSVEKNRSRQIKLIFIFTLVTLVLSVGVSILLSIWHLGRIDFTR